MATRSPARLSAQDFTAEFGRDDARSPRSLKAGEGFADMDVLLFGDKHIQVHGLGHGLVAGVIWMQMIAQS